MFALDITPAKRNACGPDHDVFEFTSRLPEGEMEGAVIFRKMPEFSGRIEPETVCQHVRNAVTVAQQEAATATPRGMLKALEYLEARMGAMLAAVPGLQFERFEKRH